MLPSTENFYAAWRAQLTPCLSLHDDGGPPPERLLQAIWQHQRLHRDRLKTAAGETIRVLHPGFISVEGGPDFRDAIIQIGEEPARTGDVEIDLRSAGWHAHGHDRNPGFKNVILHVVWDEAPVHKPARHESPSADQSALQPRPPTLSIRDTLDAPLAELALALEGRALRSLPENLRGKCCAPLRELPEAQLTELLHAAALVRLAGKAGIIRARARNSGWEQALWEYLFRALGYKNNVWPLQNLAEARPRWERGAHSAFEFQARLLGIGGLLPDELTRAQKSSDTFLRRAWDSWWRDRDAVADCLVPRSAWKFHGLRPANHPQRRLALASHWLADATFVPKIEAWGAANIPDGKLPDSLHEVFQIERDDFWSWHWTFKSARLARPQPLLGAARVTDLAVNVVLPWLWVRAREGGNEAFQREMERRFFAWPAAEDNSVLKLARQRLLGAGKSGALRTAAAQQGLMQIVRDFCEHSNAVCEQCRFPELVRGWRGNSVVPGK